MLKLEVRPEASKTIMTLAGGLRKASTGRGNRKGRPLTVVGGSGHIIISSLSETFFPSRGRQSGNITRIDSSLECIGSYFLRCTLLFPHLQFLSESVMGAPANVAPYALDVQVNRPARTNI